MKICFLVPENLGAIEDTIDPHLGLLSIAAVVRELGHSVAYSEWHWNKQILEADIYALTAHWINYQQAIEIKNKCRQINPKAKIILGGPVASSCPQWALQEFDAICIGEGEQAFIDFLQSKEIERYYFANYSDYEYGFSPPPAYDLVDWSHYSRTVLGKPAFGLMTSRGCKFNCRFCTNEHCWTKYKKQPIQAVQRDLEFCLSCTGYKSVVFWDNNFEIRSGANYLDMIGELGIEYVYYQRGKPHGMDRQFYDTGARIAFIGIESGDPALLRKMNKGVTLEEMQVAVENAQSAGISARCGIIFGFPGETPTTLERTRAYIERIKPDQVFLSFFMPFPGSDVWTYPARYGITWMAPTQQLVTQTKLGWAEASIETPWMSRDQWNKNAQEMLAWWKQLPRREEADPSWRKTLDET